MWPARSQAEAEGLTLLKADNTTGYFGVVLAHPGYPKPYKAQVRRGGKQVSLGIFATAEEAALCVARTPEGQEAATRPSAAPPLTSEEARQQAEADGLTLRVAGNRAGYYGVSISYPCLPKPYQARVRRGGKQVGLGFFATAEEAALCFARSPEGQAAAKKAAMTPLTKDEALEQARAEGLELRVTGNKAGYFGVCHTNPGQPKPYQARLKRGGKLLRLGSFATAEEAALCVARSPEGQAAAGLAAAAPSLREWIIEQQRLRRKELLSRWEQVLSTLAARSAEEEQEGGMDSEAVAVRDRSTVRQSKQVRSSRRRRCHPRGPRQGAMRKGHKRF